MDTKAIHSHAAIQILASPIAKYLGENDQHRLGEHANGNGNSWGDLQCEPLSPSGMNRARIVIGVSDTVPGKSTDGAKYFERRVRVSVTLGVNSAQPAAARKELAFFTQVLDLADQLAAPYTSPETILYKSAAEVLAEEQAHLNKQKLDKNITIFRTAISSLWHGMRVGGKGRDIPKALVTGAEHGDYEVEQRDNRGRLLKKYRCRFTEYSCTFTRTA